jgi:hypothetical protein
MITIGGGVERFVPMIMMVERGEATDKLGLFQIRQFH